MAESVTVLITSTTETTEEQLVLTETGVNTSVFRGAIQLAPGTPTPDGVVQTADGDVLTATYLDDDDGSGNPAISFDVAQLDCLGPVIENLGVEAESRPAGQQTVARVEIDPQLVRNLEGGIRG